ncbi:keratin, type I cytoskeletal 19-like [Phyllobates terribilis]|uniref:keratin, type I cytoskeletal 19-like n=1 Tax=Phyllobates terribilis TaxID=111132 RepID=UPI003CCB5E22
MYPLPESSPEQPEVIMSHGISHSSSTSLMGICHYPKASSHISSHHGGIHKVHQKSSSISHYGGHCKVPIAHGSSKHTFSAHSSSGHHNHNTHSHGSHVKISGSHHGWKNSGLLDINEKETLQHLNSRLSSYLDKVRSLEKENAQLERKICEWYASNAPSSLPDSSNYFRTIRELQNQVSSATVENARIILQIDNAQLAADDFRNKYETERNLRSNVEADVAELQRALEELNMQRRNLESEVQCLQEELIQLKSRHDEEINSLQSQLGARVNVELNAAPAVDLNRALSGVREEYENLMERNLREVESIFLNRTAELNQEMSSGAAQLQSVNNELIDLKRSVQTLGIELESQLSLKSALESTLAETETAFSSQLTQLQGMINNIESQLAKIRSDLERQNHEYQLLMNQKTHLEMEIATYKRLLDGHDIKAPSHDHSSWHKESSYHSSKC